MNAVEPPISSFGRLADLCLDHKHWPADTRPKPRSLSTLFSKLDRGQELDWLRDRVDVQQVLAHLLRRPLGDVRLSLGEGPHDSHGRVLRLRDVRFAREVDLAREDLPPGIPRVAWTPPTWGPSWWTGAAGSGKSLAAAWLQCRGLAHVALITARADLDRLPSRGALYLEISPACSSWAKPLGRADLERLRAQHRPIFFASRAAPPVDLIVERVHAPPISDYLPELVDWVAQRVDDTGHFHPDRAEQWMRLVALPSLAATTFGEVLGLLGVLDEVHPRSISSKSLDEIGQHFVTRRIREATQDSSLPPRVAEDAYTMLLECAARSLVESENELDGAYEIDTWARLLSQPHVEDVPDPEWFNVALRGELGSRIARRDLQRATTRLQPSAFALVRGLVAAQLLAPSDPVPDKDTQLKQLGPRWLLTLLKARSVTQLLHHSGFGLGQVFSNGRDPQRVLSALVASAQRGQFAPLFRVLDDFDASHLAGQAGLEAATIAAGFATLLDVELPHELVDGLIQGTAETFVVLKNEVLPRAVLDDHQDSWFSSCFWQMAVAALCRYRGLPFVHLDPFQTEDPERIALFIDATKACLARTLERLHEPDASSHGFFALPDVVVGELTLLSELLQSYAERTDVQAASELAPVYLRLVGDWTQKDQFHQAHRECPIPLLIRFACARGATPSQLMSQLWQVLADDAAPDRYLDLELTTTLWSEISPQILQRRLKLDLPIEWRHVRPHQFAQLLAHQGGALLPSTAAPYCPLDAALAHIERNGPDAFPNTTFSALMERAPGRFAQLIPAYLAHPDALQTVFEACPPSATQALVSALPDTDALMKTSPAVVDVVRKFLLRAVRQRHAQLEQSYERLVALEEPLWPLRRFP